MLLPVGQGMAGSVQESELIRHPEPAHFNICFNHGCQNLADVRLTPEQWREIRQLFPAKSVSPQQERERIAQAVGIGALKFTNLRENRGSDIVFDWDRMMSFSGDSGPYLQYTYARLRSILRKAGSAGWRIWRNSAARRTELLTGADELRVARKLAQLPEVLEEAAANYAPNLAASYLMELANLANRYYEATPILKDADKKRRNARLLLIQGVAQVLANGLAVLGIQAPEKI